MIKKISFSILLLLLFCRLSFAGSISVSQFLTGDDVTISHLETMRSTFQGAINSADGGLLQTASVTSAKLDANANVENRWNESFNDFVYTGLTIPEVTGLSSTTTAGTAYIEGVRVVKDATAHTYTTNKSTYVDLSKNGTYTYGEVAHGATAPSVAANSIRIAMVSTDTSNVITVDDVRVTSVTLGSGAVTSIQDTDQDTKVQVEKNSDEDIIRFDTDGTERVLISSSGLGLKGSTSGTTTITPTAIAGTTTLTLPAVTGTAWISGNQNVNTSQPAFLVNLASTQSNIAIGGVTIVFGTEVFDQANNFASNTFTAPVTGKYHFDAAIYTNNLDTAAVNGLDLVTSNRTYHMYQSFVRFAADVSTWTFTMSILVDMDVGDTAYLQFYQDSGTAQSDIETNSYFSGYLTF